MNKLSQSVEPYTVVRQREKINTKTDKKRGALVKIDLLSWMKLIHFERRCKRTVRSRKY